MHRGTILTTATLAVLAAAPIPAGHAHHNSCRANLLGLEIPEQLSAPYQPACDHGEPAATPALQIAGLSAIPGRVQAGRTMLFRFQLDVAQRGTVVFAGRRVRLNSNGVGRLRLRLGRPGRYRARLVGTPGLAAAPAVIRVVRSR